MGDIKIIGRHRDICHILPLLLNLNLTQMFIKRIIASTLASTLAATVHNLSVHQKNHRFRLSFHLGCHSPQSLCSSKESSLPPCLALPCLALPCLALPCLALPC